MTIKMDKEFQISINNEVLIWARNDIALNKTTASERTGIPLRRISQIEDGEQKPTLKELKEFSKVYKRTIATSLLSNPPVEKPLPRDRRTINSIELNNFHEKTILAIRKARAITKDLIELKKEAGIMIPHLKYSSELGDSAVHIAAQIRKELNLIEIRKYDNINSILEAYIEKVEDLGIAVFQLSLTQDGLRGFSLGFAQK